MFMTSTFEPQDMQARVKQSLDEANKALPEHVSRDISRARIQALAKARIYSSKQAKGSGAQVLESLRRLLTPNFPKVFAPLAVAALLVVLVSYPQTDTFPAFPGELLIADVPMEDFALLEELEFADWLAEEQQEVLR
jgi:hypothetical protein